MSGWYYRARKRIIDGAEYWDVVEYYPDVDSWSNESEEPFGETKEELIQNLKDMIRDVQNYEVLILT